MLLSLLALASPAWAAQAVIVLSMDGVGFKQLETIDPAFVLSATVTAIRPPFPSQTFPGHSTLATGVAPEIHGVFSNRPVKAEREKGYDAGDGRNQSTRLHAEPLWVTASKRGLESEVRLWPVSYGEWPSSSAHRHQERFVEESYSQVVASVLLSVKAWDRKRDFLYMSWTPGLDRVGHTYGPLGEPLKKSWSDVKANVADLERLLTAELRPGDRIVVVFAADHGMQEITKLAPLSALERVFGKDAYEAEHRWTHALFHAPLTPEEIAAKAKAAGVPLEVRPVKTGINGISAIGSLPPGTAFAGELKPGDTCRPDGKKPGWFDCQGIGQHGYPPEETPWMDAAFWTWTSDGKPLPPRPTQASGLPAFVLGTF
ncbi:MAG: alkaline phosphatase family protein [Elusimicrobia bacterium]|nr:alkaline phosphatase family protein [Elusimicrobiota bacterium]